MRNPQLLRGRRFKSPREFFTAQLEDAIFRAERVLMSLCDSEAEHASNALEEKYKDQVEKLELRKSVIEAELEKIEDARYKEVQEIRKRGRDNLKQEILLIRGNGLRKQLLLTKAGNQRALSDVLDAIESYVQTIDQLEDDTNRAEPKPKKSKPKARAKRVGR